MARFIFIIDQSVRSILTTRLRSFLSMVGVMAGAAAIISLVNISLNSRDAVLRQYDGLGYRMTTVSVSSEGTSNLLDKVKALSNTLAEYDEVKQVFYYWGLNASLEFNGSIVESSLVGLPFDQQAVIGLTPQYGTLFTQESVPGISVLLGSQLYDDFLANGEIPLPGSKLNINGSVVSVKGVLESQQDTEVFSPNYTLYLKRDSLQRLNLSINYVGIVILREAGYDYRQVENLLQTHLSLGFPYADIFMTSPEQLIKSAEEQNRMFYVLTVVLGLVSLIVGGVGIMNIMLVSVSERTSEIGVRLAVGGSANDIRLQFLIEAVLLCLAGGLLGIILAAGMTYVHTQSMQWPFMFSFMSVLIGLFSSVLIGLFFGYVPASSAANLDPVKALNTT